MLNFTNAGFEAGESARPGSSPATPATTGQEALAGRAFYRGRRANGLNTRPDQREIEPGDTLAGTIFEESLGETRALIVVLSKTRVEKPNRGSQCSITAVLSASFSSATLPGARSSIALTLVPPPASHSGARRQCPGRARRAAARVVGRPDRSVERRSFRTRGRPAGRGMPRAARRRPAKGASARRAPWRPVPAWSSAPAGSVRRSMGASAKVA